MFPASQHYLADPIPQNTTLTAEEAKPFPQQMLVDYVRVYQRLKA